ncbi:hypothetical protein SAMN06265349_10660 [Flavobacterium resistens]|uniref:DUF4421 domain-containing protein n=1 Tax=Flavobacterium resistens TaxID=443612 RepID=A0A521F1W2_9FLAO|nr:hypothetical protein [Flavobacterium resistens]MRX69364.1 hypothetical protein [Flavobacterium resistens]SMO89621.1 hypothetical protein SAMN06265349_10660 [Flavobacterium resistens]
MKKLICFMIVFFSCFLAKAQTTAEIPAETLPAVQNNSLKSDEGQNYDPEDLPWHARRFKFTAGAFFPINNTQVEVGSNNGNFGNMIDFEKDLGFKKNTQSFAASFEWRISRRSRLGSEYYYLDRTSTKTLQKDIEFGDHTYPIDGRVSAFFDNQIIRIYYGYAFVSKPTYEIGALIGAHVMLIDVGLRLEGQTQGVEFHDDFGVTAPLPDIGVWGEFVLGKKVGLYANFNYFALKVNDIDGRILSYNLSVLYNVYKNFSLTAGFTGLNIRVDAQKERLNGFFKWGYNGPTIAAVYTFGSHVKLHK